MSGLQPKGSVAPSSTVATRVMQFSSVTAEAPDIVQAEALAEEHAYSIDMLHSFD